MVSPQSRLDLLAESLRSLSAAIDRLQNVAERHWGDAIPLVTQDWYGVLTRKLLPQLVHDPALIVAIVGGTNIGKTTIFNHLAGAVVSEPSAQAAHTKHPVCLVPTSLARASTVTDLFPGFSVEPWEQHTGQERNTGQEQAASQADRLFWREGPQLPGNLLLLDTPDINSVAVDNPRRAAMIRQAADVLVAVLTSQNYNDAVVKQFFRAAGASGEDKSVFVVFSQIEPEFDEVEWPGWLAQFRAETEVDPLAVFLVPRDRKAARQMELSFWPRDPSQLAGGMTPTQPDTELCARGVEPLRSALTTLHFEAIKLRSARGALQCVIDETHGLPHWLKQLEQQAGLFARALNSQYGNRPHRETPSPDTTQRGQTAITFPAPPAVVLQDILRKCRARQRSGWLGAVQTGYDTIGQGASWAAGKVLRWGAVPESPWSSYLLQEKESLLRLLGEQLRLLEVLAIEAAPAVRLMLAPVMDPAIRSTLLQRFETEHAALRFEDQLERVVQREFDAFCRLNPEWDRFYRQLDNTMGVIRPVISVSLWVAGPFSILADGAVQVALDTVTSAAVDQAQLVRWSTAITNAWTVHRADWFRQWIATTPLGQIQTQLAAAAALPAGEEFQTTRQLLRELTLQVGQLDAGPLPVGGQHSQREASV